MHWVQQVIGEFGRQIGIPQLTLNADGVLRLQSADNSSIGIIFPARDKITEVIVYRAISADYLTANQYREALCLAHFKNPLPWPLQAACNQRELLIACRIPERSFMLSSLERSVTYLGDTLSNITQSI